MSKQTKGLRAPITIGAAQRLRLEKRMATWPPGLKLLALLIQHARQAPEVPPYSLTMVWDPDDRIFVVTVPELPGCRTHGATYEEAAAKAREAIAAWVGAAQHFGDPLPPPHVERYPLDDNPSLYVEPCEAETFGEAQRGVA